MAGGKGTRMRSRVPKLLHPLCGRTMIAWSVGAASEAGAAKVVVVQGPGRELEGALDHGVEFAVQEQARGTADAVRSASPHFQGGGTVIVVNGDHPLINPRTLRELTEVHEALFANAEVPGSAVALTEFRLGQAGHAAMGFAVHVPHYLARAEYPQAARVLVDHLAVATGLYLSTEELSHPSPLFHGDTLFVESEVLEVRPSRSKPDRGTVKVHTRAYNQDGVLVAEFKRMVLVPRKEPGEPLPSAEAGVE